MDRKSDDLIEELEKKVANHIWAMLERKIINCIWIIFAVKFICVIASTVVAALIGVL